MAKYVMRLDDASEHMDVEKWDQIEQILDKFEVKPLVGIIPDCKDPSLLVYPNDELFWINAKKWEAKGWTIALHGHTHLYVNEECGINPINRRSEFAGLSYEDQRDKLDAAYGLMASRGFKPSVFFAPSHTFDENTLLALRDATPIRIVSDTVANAPYLICPGITAVPQQSGRVRRLPFSLVTFCYHPNSMSEKDFQELELFLEKNKSRFVPFPTGQAASTLGLLDRLVRALYFSLRKVRNR